MTSAAVHPGDGKATGSPARPVPQPCKATTTAFQFDPWTITIRKSHILQSKCLCSSDDSDGPTPCTFCRCSNELSLPQLPEMLFADNQLQIAHGVNNVGIEFTALEALKLVNPSQDLFKVAIADAWREARADSEHINDVIKPFDWTFTTRYKGTLIENDHKFKVSQTDQRIDVEKLKRREQILFYDDIHLFEDELADHGCTKLSVKIRVMPSGFFVLLRFYLRVDGLMIRIQDTRLYYEVGSSYITREFSVRENKVAELGNVPPSVLTDPDEIWSHLSLVEEDIEKLEI